MFIPFHEKVCPKKASNCTLCLTANTCVCFLHQGIRARILETFVMLFLLALLILGIVWVASALIDNDAASMESLYGTLFFSVWLHYAGAASTFL